MKILEGLATLAVGMMFGIMGDELIRDTARVWSKASVRNDKPALAPPKAEQVYTDILCERGDAIFGKRRPFTTIWHLESQRRPLSFSDELEVVVSYKADFGETQERGVVVCRYQPFPTSDGHVWALERASLVKREIMPPRPATAPKAEEDEDDEGGTVQPKPAPNQ